MRGSVVDAVDVGIDVAASVDGGAAIATALVSEPLRQRGDAAGRAEFLKFTATRSRLITSIILAPSMSMIRANRGRRR